MANILLLNKKGIRKFISSFLFSNQKEYKL